MILGFTGTQQGMTAAQEKAVKYVLKTLLPEKCRHGDCLGADTEFHCYAKQLDLVVVVHPPDNPTKRSFMVGDLILPTKPYLDRNQDIVDQSDVLLVTPKGPPEIRSGTWYTYRYAKKMGKKTIVIMPDGTRWREGIPAV